LEYNRKRRHYNIATIKRLDWGGLYERMSRVSCYLCPLSRLSELEIVYKEYPELWANMKQLDKKSFRKFRYDYSLDELEEKFIKERENIILVKNLL